MYMTEDQFQASQSKIEWATEDTTITIEKKLATMNTEEKTYYLERMIETLDAMRGDIDV